MAKSAIVIRFMMIAFCSVDTGPILLSTVVLVVEVKVVLVLKVVELAVTMEPEPEPVRLPLDSAQAV
jgi:hypothetical protein